MIAASIFSLLLVMSLIDLAESIGVIRDKRRWLSNSLLQGRRAGTDVNWLAPRLVAQISFQEWTADGKLRQPLSR
jgi:ATP-dependent DNA ligase